MCQRNIGRTHWKELRVHTYTSIQIPDRIGLGGISGSVSFFERSLIVIGMSSAAHLHARTVNTRTVVQDVARLSSTLLLAHHGIDKDTSWYALEQSSAQSVDRRHLPSSQ